MAMSYVIRKTSPTVVPLALRAISISSARVALPESGSFHSHQFSTVAVDKKLVKILKSEIKSMKRTRSQVLKSLIESTKVKIPADFPFKIQDQVRCITLKRELPAENIEVIVSNTIVLRKEDNDDGSDNLINKDSSTNDGESDTDNTNDSSSDTDNSDNSSSIDSSSDDEEEKERDNANPSLVGVPLKVRILKKDGSSAMNIRVLGCADEIIVKNIEIYESGSPDGRSFSDYQCALKFKELTTDLQNSVKEFIGARGIDKTNVQFLLKYMVRRSNNIQSNNIESNIVNEGHMHFMESFKKFVSQEFVDGRTS